MTYLGYSVIIYVRRNFFYCVRDLAYTSVFCGHIESGEISKFLNVDGFSDRFKFHCNHE